MSESAPAADTPLHVPAGTSADAGLAALTTAARVAGAVIALGYLSGAVPGTISSAALALGLLTLGRSALAGGTRSLLGVGAWGVIALAVIVGALRWGSQSLDAMRGAQAVLGPGLLVEPQEAAIGVGLAAGAAVLALSLWLSVLAPNGLWGWVVSSLEGAVVGLALASAFWGPAVVGPGAGDAAELARDLGGWALAVIAALVPATALSLLWRRLSPVWSWVALLVAVAAAIAGTILVPSFVTA